jgi:catalase (peroxidase I)
MIVLVDGLRVLGANSGQSPKGVLTTTSASLTNDYFVNLPGIGTVVGDGQGRGIVRGPRAQLHDFVAPGSR